MANFGWQAWHNKAIRALDGEKDQHQEKAQIKLQQLKECDGLKVVCEGKWKLTLNRGFQRFN